MKKLVFCLALSLTLLGSTTLAGAVQYSVTATGICTGDGMPTDPAYHYMIAEGINEAGQIVGYSYSANGREAFIAEKDVNGQYVMTGLGDLPGGAFHSEATAINESGEVAGVETVGPDIFNDYEAFLWDGVTMTQISSGEQVKAVDINDAGQIAGAALDISPPGYPAIRLDPAPPFDADGDGFLYYEDCDEARIDINPGAAEVCDDTDNDCDGLVDGADPDLGYCPPPCADYTVKSECQADTSCEWIGSPKKGHCQDAPGCMPDEMPEVSCSDSVDNDCDGLTDGSDPDCGAGPEICDDGIDNDGDGKTDCADKKDCNKDPVCN